MLSSYEIPTPQKSQIEHFLENLKSIKNAQKHFLFKI